MELKHISLCLAVVLSTTCVAQTSPVYKDRSAPPTVKDPVQGGWHIAGEDDRLDLDQETKGYILQEDLKKHPHTMHTFQQLRQDRNSALARNKGMLTSEDREHLVHQAIEIERMAPNSFEAHMAHYYAEFPAPSATQHLDRAMMRDPGRDELIGPKLADAARRDHTDDLAHWSRALKDRGGVAKGLWSFADDLLLSVEQNGVLIAAGEMDAFPLWARQFADGRRKDVLIVDERLLGDPAYRQRIWEKTKARGTVPAGKEKFITELAGAIERPLFLSSALGREKLGLPPEKLYVMGLALQYSEPPLNNIPTLERNWAKMIKTTEAGPLSRNYLLPGVVLMRHYQRLEDEKNASLMEHEIRQLARAMNATKELYQVLDSPAPREKKRRPATH